jgi:hypothetical protein
MNRYERYQLNANVAQKQADRAKTESEKVAWLRLAEGWLSLVLSRPKTSAEQFDDRVKEKGTGQTPSDVSH